MAPLSLRPRLTTGSLTTGLLILVDLPLTLVLWVIALQLATPAQESFIFGGSVAYLVLGIFVPVAVGFWASRRSTGITGLRAGLFVSLFLNALVLPVGVIALSM
jgi:hypothetical protein